MMLTERVTEAQDCPNGVQLVYLFILAVLGFLHRCAGFL